MKKGMVIGVLAITAMLALGAAGLAFAQDNTPPTPPAGFGQGMMGGYGRGMMGGSGGGMMGRWGGNYGPMHDYMVIAFAEAISLTPEALQEQLDAGETMWSAAQAQGLSDEEISAAMLSARTAALEQMVADGNITQEQANYMIERMNQMHTNGFGPGSCHGGGFGRGGRWNNQP